jgi:nucleoside-diphosphate-sugar epimerase
MKVFVTGATGAIGTQLVPQLVARGHDVVGMTRWRASRGIRGQKNGQSTQRRNEQEQAQTTKQFGHR